MISLRTQHINNMGEGMLKGGGQTNGVEATLERRLSW